MAAKVHCSFLRKRAASGFTDDCRGEGIGAVRKVVGIWAPALAQQPWPDIAPARIAPDRAARTLPRAESPRT